MLMLLHTYKSLKTGNIIKGNEKITLNVSLHPSFKFLSKILRKLHVILTFDKEHLQVFKDIPLVGFRRGKSLKDILVEGIMGKVKAVQENDAVYVPLSKTQQNLQVRMEKSTTLDSQT